MLFTPAHHPAEVLLIVTPELRRWADAAVTIFGAAKACVPADLVLLCDGCAVSAFRWLWLVDQAVKLKSACPF